MIIDVHTRALHVYFCVPKSREGKYVVFTRTLVIVLIRVNLVHITRVAANI